MYLVTTLPTAGDTALRYAVGDHASGELMPASPFGDETGQLLGVRWAPGHAGAAKAIIEIALRNARPGAEVHVAANAEVHERIPERLALFAECGFTLWQEKQGFWWADEGQELLAPAGVTVSTLREIGKERYAEVVAACTAGTLDRIDADAIASLTGKRWAHELVSQLSYPDEEDIWYVISSQDGPVGFVALGAFDEEKTGTILHIGVVEGQRGHGYVNQLLRLTNIAARQRGWTGVLSDVDVLNAPMMVAMQKQGHRPGVRPWHKWVYRFKG